MTPSLEIRGLVKSFRLHNQGGVTLPVLNGLDLVVNAGECVVLSGPSGAGKSTLLRCIYGNYKPQAGAIRVLHDGETVDVVNAHHRTILELRRRTIGYVSQFLRVVPRVPTLDVVAEPLRRIGLAADAARDRAADLLDQLAIPERLWPLPPQTFSGGEQQRVNIARGLVAEQPILLLDEPTASLDAENRAAVIELLREARGRGATVVGVFHDRAVRDAVASRTLDLDAENSA